MTDDDRAVIVHRVRVPIGGMTVAEARERAKSLGLPGALARRLIGLEQVDTGWDAIVRFEVGAAGVVPVGIEVRSTRGEPLTRAVWERVRLAEVMEEAAALVSWLGPVSRQPEQATPFETGPQRRGRGKGRPSIYSAEHYRRVSSVYKAAVRHGQSPVRAVAKAFEGEFPGLTDKSDRRARSWVREARRRGYITDYKEGTE